MLACFNAVSNADSVPSALLVTVDRRGWMACTAHNSSVTPGVASFLESAPLDRVRNEKIACHRFGWMVFQRVQCFDPNTKRTNRKTQTPSYL